MNSPLYDESSDGTYHKYDTVEKVYSLKSSYARNSFSEETIQNLKKYKHSLLLKIIMVVLLILTLIAERIISYRLEKVEIDLLLNIQKSEYLGIDPFNQRNDFYFLIGMFGEFHIFFLIQTHLFISVYVAVDAFVALKTAFLQLLGCYIYSIISIYYSNPRPFWVNSQIRSYFCEKSFSEPGLFQFSSIFLIIYFYKSFKELEEDVVLVEAERNSLDSDNESFINVNSSRNKNRILKSLLIFFLMLLILIFIFRYLQGLVYLHNYFIGMVYFVSLMGIVLFFDNYLQNMIKQTTIIKRYAKGKVFFWLILLVIAEFLAVVIRNSYEKTQINLTWIENMVFNFNLLYI